MLKIKIAIIVLLVLAAGWFVYDKHHQSTVKQAAERTIQTAATAKADAAKAAQQLLDSHCVSNSAAQEVVVSISQQHMWVCDGTKTVYDNAVITGMDAYDDSTPLGTYAIFGKLTDQDLKGCDASGCWDDQVSYWMPYQEASGGTIGFHDASWRKVSDFGNISPATDNGSHGCVEMPLTAAKWLYNWSSIGTAVTIES